MGCYVLGFVTYSQIVRLQFFFFSKDILGICNGLQRLFHLLRIRLSSHTTSNSRSSYFNVRGISFCHHATQLTALKLTALRTDGLTLYIPTPQHGQTHSHKFVGSYQRIVLSVFDHVVGLALKALMQVNYQLSLIEFNVWDHSKILKCKTLDINLL